MPFFGSTYTLRRYGEDKIIDGYPTAGYEDIQVVLDVQTLSDDEVIEAGGSRDEEMLKTLEISLLEHQNRKNVLGQTSFCMMEDGLNVCLLA